MYWISGTEAYLSWKWNENLDLMERDFVELSENFVNNSISEATPE